MREVAIDQLVYLLIGAAASFFPDVSDDLAHELNVYAFVKYRFGGSRFPWEYDPDLAYGALYWSYRIPLFDTALWRVEKRQQERKQSDSPSA